MSDSQLEEAHTGPIKNPKQLLIAVLFSFVVPVFAIIALVAYVTADNKPAGSNEVGKYSLGGLTAQDLERNVNERIRKVGMVEIRDANRPLKSGKEVFDAQCTTCHTAGVAGAPKFGDAASWANRISKGFDELVKSALHGKGAMPPQSGGDFADTEIARAAAYMANAGGAKFAEPAAPVQRRLRVPPPRSPPPATARPSTTPSAWPATSPASPTRRSSATRRPGPRASRRACRCSTPRLSRARAPCRPRVVPPPPTPTSRQRSTTWSARRSKRLASS
jgi:cytochrome c5